MRHVSATQERHVLEVVAPVEPPPSPAWWLAVTHIAALALTGLAAATDLSSLQAVAAAVVMFLGVGSAALSTTRSLTPWAHLGLSVLLSSAVLVVVGTGMALSGLWYPVAAFLIVVAVATGLHVRVLAGPIPPALRRTRTASSPARHRRASLPSLSVALTVTGTLVWLGAAVADPHLDPSWHGFVTQISWLWFVGLALVVAGLVTARGDADGAVAVTALLLALVLTPAVVYDGPRSQSAGKHVELVQYIRAGRALDTENIYHAWSGFFAAMAWFCDVAGIKDPMRLATYWPVVVGLLRLSVLRFLAGAVLTGARAAWVAVAVAILADPLGADYFSPQSLGLVLAVGALATALTVGRGPARPVLLASIAAVGLAMAPEHQLSPYLLVGALLVLTVFGLLRPVWLAAVVAVPALLWAAFMHKALSGYLYLGGFQGSNFRPPQTVGSATLERLPVVRLASLALLAGVALLCLLGAVALARRVSDRRRWAFGVCAGLGLVPLALNPYGNEGIFRAILFAVPWLALLAVMGLSRREGSVREPVAAVLSVALVGTFLTAAFGMDATSVVRPADLAVTREFRASTSPESVVLLLGQGDLVSGLPRRDPSWTTVRRADIDDPVVERASTDPATEAGRLTAAYASWGRAHRRAPRDLYAIWSPVQSHYGRAYALQTEEQFAQMRDGLLASEDWDVVMQREGTYLFRLRRDPGSGAG